MVEDNRFVGGRLATELWAKPSDHTDEEAACQQKDSPDGETQRGSRHKQALNRDGEQYTRIVSVRRRSNACTACGPLLQFAL